MKKLFNIRSDAYILRLDSGGNPCTEPPSHRQMCFILNSNFQLPTSNFICVSPGGVIYYLPSSNWRYYNVGMSGHYSIAKVAQMTGFSVPTLRFYEQEGLILPVPRDGAGNRMYGEKEMTRINTIRCLRAAGLTLPHMKRYFALPDEGEESIRVRRELMLHTQDNLRRQQRELERCMRYLSLKLDYYDAMLDALQQGHEPPVFHPEKLNSLFEKAEPGEDIS